MIKVKKLERGYALKINGLYISQGAYSGAPIKAVIIEPGKENKTSNISVYVSIEGVRCLWNKRRSEIIASLNNPYIEVNGNLTTTNEKTRTIDDATALYGEITNK